MCPIIGQASYTRYTDIKTLKYIFIALLAVALLLYGLPVVLVHVPAVQRHLAKGASHLLTAKLGAPVKLGEVDITWPDGLTLRKVAIDDLSGRPLLRADRLSGGIDLGALLLGQVRFTSARLIGFDIQLRKANPDSPLNAQFIFDALASKDTTSTGGIDLAIRGIRLSRGRMSYDVGRGQPLAGRFDATHLRADDIDAKATLHELHGDRLRVEVHRLRFRERSGLEIRHLSGDLRKLGKQLELRHLLLHLPRTYLHISVATTRLPLDSDDTPIRLNLQPSEVCLADLGALVPALSDLPETLRVAATVSGTLNNPVLDELSVSQDEALSLTARAMLRDVRYAQRLYIDGRVSRLQVTTAGAGMLLRRLGGDPSAALPSVIERLGTLHFSGEISGFLDKLVAYGTLNSDVGRLAMDIMIGRDRSQRIATSLQGRIESSDLDMHRLFDEGNAFGNAHFSAELDASEPIGGEWAGIVRARIDRLEYNQYGYENIELDGSFRPREFRGSIRMDDPNGSLHADGLFLSNGAASAFDFTATVHHLRPDRLRLTDRYEEPDLSFDLRSNMTGNSPDNFRGTVCIDAPVFRTRTDSLALRSVCIEADGQPSDRRIAVRSELLDGELRGAFAVADLPAAFREVMHACLPSVFEAPAKRIAATAESPRFALNASVRNTEVLSRLLGLPVTVVEPATIAADYDGRTGHVHLTADLPHFLAAGSTFRAGKLAADNADGPVRVQIEADRLQQEGNQSHIHVEAEAESDRLKTRLAFRYPEAGVDLALSAATHFSMHTGADGRQALLADIDLEPNRLVIRDSTWQTEPASVTIDGRDITIRNIHLANGSQYLRINGRLSERDPQETLLLDLNDLELRDIFRIVDIPVLQFGGRATGTVRLNDLYGSRIISTDLDIRDFAFNDVVQGRLNLFSAWDNARNGILMRGTIFKDSTTFTDVNGYIFPVGDSAGLALQFDAHNLDVGLLRPYLDAFTHTLDGRATGRMRLYGTFSEINFEGSAMIRDGRIGVDFLNTVYSFNDSVRLTPTAIEGRAITLTDRNGHTGTLDFTVRHNHLENFAFQADIAARNLLLYDVPRKMNPRIYGSVSGTGTARLRGTEQLIDIDAAVTTDRQTAMSFDFNSASSAEDYGFIRFLPPVLTDTALALRPPLIVPTADDDATEIRINITTDITPDASFELVMDPIAGDRIRGNGTGNLQIKYSTNADLGLYGTYTIREGNYNFSLEQVLRKEFRIREGSRIDFRGNPTDALLDLSAVYALKADIEDLDERLASESGSQRTIPVNCILRLNGRLTSPAIAFDMEFPNSTGELARQVRAFIGTEDMMTRQIIYLLAIGRFYTPGYSGNGFRAGELNAVASSALSAQLSGILSSLTDKVRIGTNIRTQQDGTSDSDTEMEMLLSGRLLNNRLLFNGNFGYRGNYIQRNAFIGEFDLEYLLGPTGDIRLKAYSHANDLYRYNFKSLTRQGVGILFHRDFTSPAELIRRRSPRPVQSK